MLSRGLVKWFHYFLFRLSCFLWFIFEFKGWLLKLFLLHDLLNLFWLPFWELYVVSNDLVVIDVIVFDLI